MQGRHVDGVYKVNRQWTSSSRVRKDHAYGGIYPRSCRTLYPFGVPQVAARKSGSRSLGIVHDEVAG